MREAALASQTPSSGLDGRPEWGRFPFDLLRHTSFPEPAGGFIRAVRHLSMIPPFPWGHWAYGRFLSERGANLHGDIVEAGVGLGGMSLFLALMQRRRGLRRTIFAVDTFAGLPQPDSAHDNAYFTPGEYGAAPGAPDLEMRLWAEAERLGVGADVVPVRGRFEETLPRLAAQGPLALVHIDADLYASVAAALRALYDAVDEGGAIAIDDFFHPGQGAIRAAGEFFNERGLIPLYHVVFPYAVLIVKGERSDAEQRRSVDGNAYAFDLVRDPVFVAALEQSVRRAGDDADARAAAETLLELVHGGPQTHGIYDYWRALDSWWRWIDVLPEQRATHLL